MPINDAYARVPLDAITISPDRQRRDLRLDEGFLSSIRKRGVVNPIIVQGSVGDGTVTLVAGERRLAASRAIGLPDIPVRFTSDLTNIELEIIELEENIKRENLHWRDLVRAVARIHELYCIADPDWTLSETSEAIGLNKGSISEYMTVHAAFEDPNVAQSGTIREAYNLLLRRQKRAAGDALAELLEMGVPVQSPVVVAQQAHVTALDQIATDQPITASVEFVGPITTLPPSEPTLPGFNLDPIVVADFVEWAPVYTGRKFNLIHCDFPYGVNLFSANGIRSGPNRSQMGRDEGESYDDDADTYRTLVETLCQNLDRLMSFSGHIMFWFSNKWEIESWTRDHFAKNAPSVSWTRFPLIWLKSDNAGIAASPNYEPRHVYETCLLGSRGKRTIVKVKSDAYSAPTDKSLHQSCKPEPMLRHFMEMLVDENTMMLDPTCGSGTALRAAESLGAKTVLGLERDEKMVAMALRALHLERAKRKAAREW